MKIEKLYKDRTQDLALLMGIKSERPGSQVAYIRAMFYDCGHQERKKALEESVDELEVLKV